MKDFIKQGKMQDFLYEKFRNFLKQQPDKLGDDILAEDTPEEREVEEDGAEWL